MRIQRGVSLQQIAAETNVSEVLWAALERSDFSRWPNGIFARAYVRDYAKLIGADPDATVDEFCRWFPQGDRRADREIRVQAEIVNHQLQAGDELPPDVTEDRRWSPENSDQDTPRERTNTNSRSPGVFDRLRRALSRA